MQAGDEGTAAAVQAGRLPRKLAARQKVLRSAAILAAAHNAKPAAKLVPRKQKGDGKSRAQQQQQQQQPAASRKRGSGHAAAAGEGQDALDMWGDGAGEPQQQQQQPTKRAKRGSSSAVVAAAAAAGAAAAAALRRPAVPAVEIDPAGCSYNPDREQHQEAVALAVAAETRKLLDKVG